MSLTPLVLLDTKIYFDAADLTGYSNKLMAGITVAELDHTTFGSAGYKERVGGLFDVAASLEGFYAAGDPTKPNDAFWAGLSNSGMALTLVPTGGALGDLCFVSRVMETQYEPSGQVGELYAFAVDWAGNWPMALGQILNPASTPRTSNGNGTGRQLGAVASNQAMYAALHVQAASGTSVTVKIQSSSDNTFASPTDQIVFTAATAVGGQTARVVGPVTDTWWRAVWTVAGSSPSFTFVSSAGVAAK